MPQACDNLLKKVRKLDYDAKAIQEWCGKEYRACVELTRETRFLDDNFTNAMALPKHSSIRPLITLTKTHPDIVEDVLEEVRKLEEPTRAKITAIVKAYTKPELISPPEGFFNVIVIDPPWPLGDVEYEYRDRSSTINRAIERPYHWMSIEDIMNMKIPAADDCILWLWTTNINLHNAFHVLEEWGFTYRSCLTWAKPTMGLGYWLRGQTEHCLLATKGSPIWSNTRERTLLNADRKEDSRKPDAFYLLVDRICKGTKIDMFSREDREGWEQWGDEVDKF